MNKKPDLTGLIAVKGSAAPATAAPLAVVEAKSPAPVAAEPAEKDLSPLNFKVPAAFKRQFKTYAAAHDMSLIALLKRSFEAYRKQQGD